MDSRIAARLRTLPQVQKLLEMPEAPPLVERHGRQAVIAALRVQLGGARARLLGGAAEAASATALLAGAAAHLRAEAAPGLRRVINATGVVLHTNLGRAPMAMEAAEAVFAVARGYSNLEFDLGSGTRGARTQAVEPLLQALTGAEAAIAVNNCAAALLLAFAGLAAGGEVIVSRGELVEIGGGFRIPDVIRQSGARLVEVGTTNKTRLADYEGAVTPETRVILKVHQSNFQIVGFAASVAAGPLAALARRRSLLMVDDLGSGLMADFRQPGDARERTVQESVAEGVDVVAFSGDKLLGGPQAGLLVGRRDAIEALRRHPLMRALRLDKMSLAALEATLRLHRDRGPQSLPALRAIGQGEAALRDRARRLATMIGSGAEVTATQGFAGGGTLPNEAIASAAVRLRVEHIGPDELAARLRRQSPAMVGRIAGGCVLLDMLTVADDELAEAAAAVHKAVAE